MNPDYSKDLFRQLEDVYAKLDGIEEKHARQISKLEDKVDELTDELKIAKTDLRKKSAELDKTKAELSIVKGDLSKVRDNLSDANNKIDSLTVENTILKDDNERMKRILNNNSDNSSLPPSAGGGSGKAANMFNGRKKTGRKHGAQKGHSGRHLSKADLEEKIARNEVECKEVAIGTPSKEYVTRYRVDLKLKTVATKYIIYADSNGKYNIPSELTADVTYGPVVKAISSYLYSEGVVAFDRIADFINSASGNTLNISSGAIYGFCSTFANLCKGAKNEIEENLLNGKVICTDATNIRKDGKQTYIRNFSNDLNVLYVYSPKKKISVLQNMPILNKFAGILVHDHESSLYHFGTGHGECNVHLERYLRKNTEETHNRWSHDLMNFLIGMNNARKKKISNGEHSFSEEELVKYEARFSEILAQATEQHKKTTGAIAYKEEKTLINRINKYKENHLLFLHDFDVPYDDNMSERDLRKCKNRQKMAGGFRTDDGIEMYCSIMSAVETIKRKKMNILDGISEMFTAGSALT